MMLYLITPQYLIRTVGRASVYTPTGEESRISGYIITTCNKKYAIFDTTTKLMCVCCGIMDWVYRD